ncbi:hypothetical protein BGZ74_010954 [Mortierella antarctica]|nr:hypothetical protein BGZ74_010954 [Mortierella antarctica]
MSSVTQDVPTTTTTSARLVKVPITTKRTLSLSTSSTSMETGLEDMPPDLGSDSSEDADDENTMHATLSYSPAPSLSSSTTSPMAPRPVHKNVSLSPSYSSSQPISILHNSKSSPTKSVAFRPPFELDLEPEPKSTKGLPNDTDNKNESELAPPQETTLNRLLCPPPSEMLVALFDRPSELKALAAIHSDFFNLMSSSLCSSARGAFKTLLFTPRDAISDRDWMQAIAQRLNSLPCLLEKFKALVGWVDDDTYDSDRAWNDDDDEYDYEDSLEQVEIKWFRDLDGFTVEVFEKCYPQFFVNVRERLQGRHVALGGDHRDQYVVFCETLGLSRQELACDNAWTRRMNGCLEKHPELLLQFKEIVAYEICDYLVGTSTRQSGSSVV